MVQKNRRVVNQNSSKISILSRNQFHSLTIFHSILSTKCQHVWVATATWLCLHFLASKSRQIFQTLAVVVSSHDSIFPPNVNWKWKFDEKSLFLSVCGEISFRSLRILIKSHLRLLFLSAAFSFSFEFIFSFSNSIFRLFFLFGYF